MADLSRWPDLLREVAEVLGEDAGLLLAAKYGGQRLYVPGALTTARDRQTEAARARLAEELGNELADHLIEYHGGALIPIPSFASRLAEERRIFILGNPELSANTIAARLGISYRRVEQVRRAAREQPDQLSLFS